MRILVVSANREKFPDPVFPLGASYIAHSVKSAGHETDVFDACFSAEPEEELAVKIKDFMPDVIAFSIRNVDNNVFPDTVNYLPYYQSLMKVIRANTGASVVVGGAAYTIFPEYFVEELGADFGIAGEGEYTFLKLLEDIKNGTPPDNRVLKSSSIKDINFDSVPLRIGFEPDKYFNEGGCINIQTKRGCAFNCSYCTYPSIEGHEYRMRTPVKIVDEIEYWNNKGITHFFFVDSVFNHPEDYAFSIVKEIIRRKLKIKWSCFFAPIFTEEFLLACIEAGLSSIDLGTDAFSDKTLKGFHKFFTVEDIFRSCALCKKHNLMFNHSLIFGGPGETYETLEETVHNVELSDPTSVIGYIGVRLYPNTPIIKQVGITDKVGIDPVFYLSEDVKDGIVDFLRERLKGIDNWIIPGLNKGVNKTIFERMRKRGIKGQLWEFMTTLMKK